MLVNFALDVVGTKISCDKVSTDGHESTNLISTNLHLRRKGFIAEYFIKPPVNITLEFPCPVCIHSVLVTPCVGQQRSSQFELYSASKPSAKVFHNSKGYKPSEGASSTNGNVKISDNSVPPLFYPVAKVSFSDSNRILFYNPKFSFHGNLDPTPDGMDCKLKVGIHHFRKELTAACSHLTLRVIRTQGSSTAAVSNLDVWGVPAISLPTGIKEDIVNKYKQFLTPPPTVQTGKQHKNENVQKCVITEKSSSSQNEDEELNIPEEFIDPLTCEVMAIPMLLPCGKNVDLSTLDRFYNTEASYGRKPRDPFTGVEFSDTSRPIPNGALKSRIDQFLMRHSDNNATAAIARTVGGEGKVSLLGKRKASEKLNVPSCVPQSSKMDKGVSSSQKDISASGGKQVSRPYYSSTVLRANADCKHNQTSIHNTPPFQNDKGDGTVVSNVMQECGKRLERIADAVSSATRKDKHQVPSHENQLQSSLNDALSSILSGLPSYSSTVTSQRNEETTKLCTACNTKLTADTLSYALSCDHLVCRKCLTTSEQESSTICCAICGQLCEKSHVTRSHHRT